VCVCTHMCVFVYVSFGLSSSKYHIGKVVVQWCSKPLMTMGSLCLRKYYCNILTSPILNNIVCKGTREGVDSISGRLEQI
jgi:hypothetical protein